ncbi:MAG: AsmA family protein [Rhizobiales bacterium]|nr:AsmA family protein [Hyphomicrobiales bacterium]
MKTLACLLAILASLFGGLILIGAAAAVALQAGLLNDWIETAIGDRAGQSAELEKAPALGFRAGTLTLDLGPLRIENAEWARARNRNVVTIEDIHAALRLTPLFDRRVVFSAIDIQNPKIYLARSAQGKVNWPQGESSRDGGDKGNVLPEIEHLQIHDAEITYSGPEAASDIHLWLAEIMGEFDARNDLRFSASGTLQEEPLHIEASRGPLGPLLAEGRAAGPVVVEARLGESTLSSEITSFQGLDDLEGNVALDAKAGLARVLSSLGLAAPDLPAFAADMQIEPSEKGSLATAMISMGRDRLEATATVSDIAAPLEQLDVTVEADGANLADLLDLAGLSVEGDLPSYQVSGRFLSKGQSYEVRTFTAVLGDNQVTGDAVVQDLATLDGLDASLRIDAPDLVPLLVTFEIPGAEQITSAVLGLDIERSGETTDVRVDGDISGDEIELDGSYEGALTAFANPRLDLLLEGSAFGRLAERLEIRARPIESYRIDAVVEERTGEASPVTVDATIEDTRIQFDGLIDDLRAFKGIDGDAVIEGPNPSDILELFELPAINLPPYRLGGRLTWRGDDIAVAGLDGVVGDSDARGDIAIDLRPEPVTVTAELRSDRLDFDDLAGLVGAPPSTDEGETASEEQQAQSERREEQDRLLPTLEIDPANWQNLDLDVRYRADRIDAENLPIDRIDFRVVTDGRWLTLDPLDTGLADGRIVAFASLDGTQDPLAGDFDVRITNLQLQEFLAKLGVGGEGLGEISGRLRLTGRGRSLDELLGTSDGSIGLTMSGGKLDALIIEGVGLDIAESLAVLMDASDQRNEDKVPIRCAVANLEFEKGTARANPIVVDTPDSKLTAQGTIDLADETMDLVLESHPKDSSFLSANQPIRVDGKLLAPSVAPAPGKIENKTLGWILAPIAAVLPFFDSGGEPDSPCARLIAEAERAASENPDESEPR